MAEEDLIFGKMRHLFGGMEPSNMINFTIDTTDGVVKIDAQLPDNTIIDGQTLCTVAGAVIRRKSDDFPVDEFDGDLIENIKNSKVIVDSSATTTETYYYAAFPYTTRGVYNRNPMNRAAINTPEPMIVFSAISASSAVKITVDLPDTAVGAIIRKSPDRYPVSEVDGDECMIVTEDGSYLDTDVTVGLTYYYSAFPYTKSGAFNRDKVNRASATVGVHSYLFGYDLDTTDSDPATRVSYPSDVDNAGYAAAYMDYSTGLFNYGDWPSTPGEKFMPKPCILRPDCTVAYYLNPDDFTKKEDGTSITSSDGHAMVEWPKIYTKRWEENGVYHFRCSDAPIDADYDCWCNYDKNNNEIDHFYTACYAGYIDSDNRLWSQSGASYSTSKTIDAFISAARTNGDDWCIDLLSDHLLIQDLLVMMAKTTSCQTAYGNGRISATSLINIGYSDGKGMFHGYNSSNGAVKVFGMENLWGNAKRRLVGWMVDSDFKYKVKVTRGTHDGTTTTDYNTTSDGYLTVSDYQMNSYGYISGMITKPFGRIPNILSGSNSTYECDYGDFSNVSGIYCSSVGGYYEESKQAGPFYIRMTQAPTGKDSYTVGRLSCKPLALK